MQNSKYSVGVEVNLNYYCYFVTDFHGPMEHLEVRRLVSLDCVDCRSACGVCEVCVASANINHKIR